MSSSVVLTSPPNLSLSLSLSLSSLSSLSLSLSQMYFTSPISGVEAHPTPSASMIHSTQTSSAERALFFLQFLTTCTCTLQTIQMGLLGSVDGGDDDGGDVVVVGGGGEEGMLRGFCSGGTGEYEVATSAGPLG